MRESSETLKCQFQADKSRNQIISGRPYHEFTSCYIIGNNGNCAKPRTNFMRMIQEFMLDLRLENAQLSKDISLVCESGKTNLRVSLGLDNIEGYKFLPPAEKVGFFIHGWRDGGNTEWNLKILRSWIRFAPEYNVCVVDWGLLSQANYKIASKSVFDVGLTLATIIENLEKLLPSTFDRSSVILVGYSLGAHAAGFAGSYLKGMVEQIIGLDPANPIFSWPCPVASKYRLDETDAQYVQVMHTSGGSFGTSVKSGHADYYPNGGKAVQPNCNPPPLFNDGFNTNPVTCSHSTALKFFEKSLNPEYPFIGINCASYDAFIAGKCDFTQLSRFGVHSTNRMRGDFYFATLPTDPYIHSIRLREYCIEPFETPWLMSI